MNSDSGFLSRTSEMEPLSGLALACNIIDLVGVAIKCGKAAAEIYSSVDGRTREHDDVAI